MLKPPSKVLAMHDMCGYGRSSLTAVMTVLPSLNCQVCPLPTALLAHHFGFNVLPSVLNLGDELRKFLPLWKEMQLQFDCFYSGYLASPDQVGIAEDYITTFKPRFVFVDPVLGDNKHLYHGFNEHQVDAMRRLITKADAISPNVTEAGFLLGKEPAVCINDSEAKEMLLALSAMGPQKVAITGSHAEGDSYVVSYAYDAEKNEFYSCNNPFVTLNLHGTGDSFASVLVGRLLGGFTFESALRQATSYLYKCAELAGGWDLELCLEPPLPSLMEGNEDVSFRRF
jgi:pyridoxine kinase